MEVLVRQCGWFGDPAVLKQWASARRGRPKGLLNIQRCLQAPSTELALGVLVVLRARVDGALFARLLTAKVNKVVGVAEALLELTARVVHHNGVLF